MTEQKLNKTELRVRRCLSLGLPSYTLGEEVLNAISHGAGAIFAVVALVILLWNAPHDTLTLVGVSVFGGTMFLLYTVSTLYHAMGLNRAKKIFQVLDHCTIYLLIAGTYTPITLLCMGGAAGWTLCIFVWVLAVTGIVMNAVAMSRFKKLSMVLYIGMGWCVVFFVKPLVETLDTRSLIFLVIGGVLYTIGAVLYGKGKNVRYMHAVWHLFCVAASFFHFLVVYAVALSRPVI